MNTDKLRGTISNMVSRIRGWYYRRMGIVVGKDCMISVGAKLDCRRGRLVIGDRCTITHGCVILAHDRARKVVSRKINRHNDMGAVTRLGNDVFVGVNSVICFGVTVGENSIIGAGAIVTKDVPPNVVVAGNPARIIRTLSEAEDQA